MKGSMIEYILKENLKYYPDMVELFDLIGNYSDDFAYRYVTDDPGSMRFAMVYQGRDLVLVGDVDEGSEFYEIVGDISGYDFRGDDILGFSILLDMILMDTVPESLVLWETYISSLLSIEGKTFTEKNVPPFYLTKKNNPDLVSTEIEKLWKVDVESLQEQGVFTVTQLREAIKKNLVGNSNKMALALRYFDFEVYEPDVSGDEIEDYLNESGYGQFTFEYITDEEEFYVEVDSRRDLVDVARLLFNDGYLHEIVSRSPDFVAAYMEVEGGFSRILLGLV